MTTFNAQTLIKQLGTALPMMGAKDLVTYPDHLAFRIGRNRWSVNRVAIYLAADDTYRIEALQVRGLSFQVVALETDVYVDQLHEALERLTGLATRL